jgi:methylisocitrate lyase
MEEHVGKLRAMIAARQNPEVLIIARTDAVDPAEAIRRGKAYVAAGADIIQPISRCFKNFEGLQAMREGCGVPLSLQILAWLETDLDRKQIEQVAALATYPLVALMTATEAMRTNLRARHGQVVKQLPLPVTPMHDFNDASASTGSMPYST